MFRTRAPSGKSMPRKKISDQPLCERSSRTGVRSTRIGNSASSDSRARSRGWMRSGCSSTPPTRNIHRLPRQLRTDRRTWSARSWKATCSYAWARALADGAVGPVAAHGLEEGGDRLLVPPLHQVPEAGERDQARAARSAGSPGCRSGTAHGGRARPGPARRGWCASGGTARAPRRPGASRPGWPPATSSRAERSRTEGSAWVIVSMRSWPAVDMVGVRGSWEVEAVRDLRAVGIRGHHAAYPARPGRPIPAAVRGSGPGRRRRGPGRSGPRPCRT